LQAPLLSQAVAPQAISAVSQAAVQHFPVWSTPQIPETHASSSMQAVPSASVTTQLPLKHQEPVLQSAVLVQLFPQAVALAHLRSSEHGIGVPASHPPDPLQAPGVSMLPVQLGIPQVVGVVG
jgi:hypothetical protein